MLKPISLRRCLIALLLLTAPGASADTGRIEINQAVVDAAGGFPYLISSPGSYVLTSDLVATTDVSAILINGPLLGGRQVSIDLNGFAIEGASSCSSMDCPLGSALGIGPFAGNAGRTTIWNGTVRGFSGSCVSLSGDARVEAMSVGSCGRTGIFVDQGSVVLGNRVRFTGQRGIHMGSGTTFAHNTVSNVSLASTLGTSFPAFDGGTATAGNFCDDGSCSLDGRRRYYLTTGTYNGSQALTACGAGFHMASLWEILDPTVLQYDTTRGQTTEDSGSGPPGNIGAWIRTGKPLGTASSSPGGESCSGYTTTSENGTRVWLPRDWDSDPVSTTLTAPWWNGTLSSCAGASPVWCTED
jgi:hypothetical protein